MTNDDICRVAIDTLADHNIKNAEARTFDIDIHTWLVLTVDKLTSSIYVFHHTDELTPEFVSEITGTVMLQTLRELGIQ